MTRVTLWYPDQTPSGLPKVRHVSHIAIRIKLHPNSPKGYALHIWINSIQTSPKREHVACIDIRIKLHPDSPRGYVTPFPYPDSLRVRHTTLANITSGRPTYPIRICLSGSLTEVSKSCYIILTACHSDSLTQPTIRRLQGKRTKRVASHLRRSVACRTKGREWWQVTSHDLCQPPTGWWWPCHHLGVIMTNQKILSSLMREDELLTLYKGTFTQGRR